ncbi:hypothetical protein NKG05_10705 [Oerskovia sp. M15]
MIAPLLLPELDRAPEEAVLAEPPSAQVPRWRPTNPRPLRTVRCAVGHRWTSSPTRPDATHPAPAPTKGALRDVSLALEASRIHARAIEADLAAAQAEVVALQAASQATTVELTGLRQRAAELDLDLTAAQHRATNFQTKYRKADLSRQRLKKAERSAAHADAAPDDGWRS